MRRRGQGDAAAGSRFRMQTGVIWLQAGQLWTPPCWVLQARGLGGDESGFQQQALALSVHVFLYMNTCVSYAATWKVWTGPRQQASRWRCS